MALKTRANWRGDLGSYLAIGDTVDWEMYTHFLEVVYPAHMSSSLLQMGEPASHVDGKPTFLTLKRISEGRADIEVWEYRGACFRGHDREPGADGQR